MAAISRMRRALTRRRDDRVPNVTDEGEAPSPVSPPSLSYVERRLLAYTASAIRRPKLVLCIAVAIAAVSFGLASRLRLQSDFLSLLPTKSETARRFHEALARKGGTASTLLVVIESSDADANRRFAEAIADRLRVLPASLVGSVRTGAEPERRFFHDFRWVFPSQRDLMLVECELRTEWQRRLPGYLDLDDSCDDQVAFELSGTPDDQRRDEESPTPHSKPDDASPSLRDLAARLDRMAAEQDRFPKGYFSNPAGTRFAVVARSPGAGMGELTSDELYRAAQRAVHELRPETFQRNMQVGFAGDIPNAIAERKSLVEDITLVTSLATASILAVILIYFRSPLALLHIGLSMCVGCGAAFATAQLVYGHVNMATSFLGSIIAGNGINAPIIYLARYHERRGQGDDCERALYRTALDCRRGTALGALAAAGAYAALATTSFRGFSEFGLIGGVGMIACWVSAFSVCPASITLVESITDRERRAHGKRRPFLMHHLGRVTASRPAFMLAAATALAAAVALPVRRYLSDPWEYDFAKLRSASSTQRGAGHWSTLADEIFGARGTPDMLLAGDAAHALPLAEAVKARDRASPSRLVERVTTIHDYLGGGPEVVTRKMRTLDEIRAHVDRLLPRLQGEDRNLAERLRPPDGFHPPTELDLPPEILDRFSELDGRVGTPVYVQIDRNLSRSRGQNLLRIADLLEGMRQDGKVVPNASRATVFAEMIRSMTQDAPRAIFVAMTTVLVVSVAATRTFSLVIAVVGSLLLGVWLTLGAAACFQVRLNFLNFVALPLTFGIGVEYAINLADRIRTVGSISAGIRSAGGAVAVCSLTTMLGYGSLLVGDNLALKSFGEYAVFGELCCLTTALFVMPAMLHLTFPPLNRRGTGPVG
jgi:predicted exporter